MKKIIFGLIALIALTACRHGDASESTKVSETIEGGNPYTGDTWKEIDPKELKINPFEFFSQGLALCVGQKDSMNAMAIGWGSLGVLWGRDRAIANVYVEKRRFTLHFMEEGEYFVIEAFPQKHQDVVAYLGTASGRDEDKMKGSGLTVKFTDNGTPYFDEGCVMLECRKIYQTVLDTAGFGDVPREVYKDRPLHTEFIGEIITCKVKE